MRRLLVVSYTCDGTPQTFTETSMLPAELEKYVSPVPKYYTAVHPELHDPSLTADRSQTPAI